MYFLHPRWLFGISEPSTVSFMAPEFITFCHWGLDVLRALQHFADGERRPGAQPRLGPGTEEIGSKKHEKKTTKSGHILIPHSPPLGGSKMKFDALLFFGKWQEKEKQPTNVTRQERDLSPAAFLSWLMFRPSPAGITLIVPWRIFFGALGFPGTPERRSSVLNALHVGKLYRSSHESIRHGWCFFTAKVVMLVSSRLWWHVWTTRR